MFKYLLFLIITISFASAQDIPDSRICDWQRPAKEAQPSDNIINAIEAGLKTGGAIPNDEALKQILDENDSVTVFFPEGVFLFENPVNLRSNQNIIGSGRETQFFFNGDAGSDFIVIRGTKYRTLIQLNTDVQQGQKSLPDPDSRLSENYMYLIKDNDSSKITSDWASFSTGQMISIAGLNGDSAITDRQIRRYFDSGAYMEMFSPAENIVLKGFLIYNGSQADGQFANIRIINGRNILIECIESYFCHFAHIAINESKEITVRGSYFNDAHSFGGGGRGYGIAVQYSSGDCLIENNIFERLRHSILLQAGANGNIISYNYSHSPFWTEENLPSDAAGDIVLHGNYPYMNLFESNICQNIVIDDSHGINGPNNTFLRNRAENYGIFMNFAPPSDNQNFIGNEITSTELLRGLYFLNGNGHFEYGNRVQGEVEPSGTDVIDIVSLFESDEDIIEKRLPLIGYPEEYNNTNIPAKERYENGILTECGEPSSVLNGKNDIEKSVPGIFSNINYLISLVSDKDFRLFNACGEVLQINDINDITSCPNGLYIVIADDGSRYMYLNVW